MKIDIRIGKNALTPEVKTLVTNEKLVLATPCLLKFQEVWFNEIINPGPSPRIRVSETTGEDFSRPEMTCIYAKLFLHAQHVQTGREFFLWWTSLLELTGDKLEGVDKKLKQLGLGPDKLDQRWEEMKLHQKVLLLLVPAGEKFKVIHFFLGDYFIAPQDLSVLNNQLNSWLGISETNLILFWSFTLRETKGAKLYFTGFTEETAPESRS